MNGRGWAERYRERASWAYTYGDSAAGITLVGASTEMRQALKVISEIVAARYRCLLVHGPRGSGMSALLGSLVAALEDGGRAYRAIATSVDAGRLLRDIRQGEVSDVVLIDDCERLGSSVLSQVVEGRDRFQGGLVMTAHEVSASTVFALGSEHDHTVRLSALIDRPDDLLLLASLFWEQLANGSNLSGSCDNEAIEGLLQGPYPDGAWTLRRVLEELADALVSEGALADGRLTRTIARADLTLSLNSVIRASLPSVGPPEPIAGVLVTEGSTDKTYLKLAAQLAERERGWRLLEGLEIESAGGATKMLELLFATRVGARAVIGLYDLDEIGRNCARQAREHHLETLLLPHRVDPLQRAANEAVVEIEDLLPQELLEQFYAVHPDVRPEERRWRNGYWQLIPRGEDKELLADWIGTRARYEDVEALVIVLCLARRKLRLPAPPNVVPDEQWFDVVRSRLRIDMTAGLSPALTDADS